MTPKQILCTVPHPYYKPWSLVQDDKHPRPYWEFEDENGETRGHASSFHDIYLAKQNKKMREALQAAMAFMQRLSFGDDMDTGPKAWAEAYEPMKKIQEALKEEASSTPENHVKLPDIGEWGIAVFNGPLGTHRTVEGRVARHWSGDLCIQENGRHDREYRFVDSSFIGFIPQQDPKSDNEA